MLALLDPDRATLVMGGRNGVREGSLLRSPRFTRLRKNLEAIKRVVWDLGLMLLLPTRLCIASE